MNRYEESMWGVVAQTVAQRGTPLPQTLSERAVKSSACGKSILVGEHAVCYGARAVAMPLSSMRVSIHVTARPSADPVRLYLDGKSVSDHLSSVVTEATQFLGMPSKGLSVQGNSGVLIGAGLGSSASLCIVLLRALATLTDKSLSTDELARLGNALEKRFHGNPSGLDTAVVAFEQPIVFSQQEGVRVIERTRTCEPEGGIPFVLIDSGLRSSTVAMINVAKPYFTGSDGDSRVRRFDDLARDVELGLSGCDLSAVGAAMTEAHSLLRDAGIVNQQLDDIVDTCERAGVHGAKVTGAGGGGCVLALLDPERKDEQTAQLRKAFGERCVYSVRLDG